MLDDAPLVGKFEYVALVHGDLRSSLTHGHIPV